MFAQFRGTGRLGLATQSLPSSLHLGQLLFPPADLFLRVVHTLSRVVGSVGRFGFPEHVLDLRSDSLVVLDHPLKAHRFVFARVGFHLRPVDCHMSEFHKPG